MWPLPPHEQIRVGSQEFQLAQQGRFSSSPPWVVAGEIKRKPESKRPRAGLPLPHPSTLTEAQAGSTVSSWPGSKEPVPLTHHGGGTVEAVENGDFSNDLLGMRTPLTPGSPDIPPHPAAAGAHTLPSAPASVGTCRGAWTPVSFWLQRGTTPHSDQSGVGGDDAAQDFHPPPVDHETRLLYPSGDSLPETRWRASTSSFILWSSTTW